MIADMKRIFHAVSLAVIWIFVNGQTGKNTIAKVRGNITIGALFPMHLRPSAEDVFTRTCGKIREQYGIHRIEIFLKTLDEINANDDILPNITLGADIRDSCWYAPVALEQSIDFIKNSIASQERMSKNRTGIMHFCHLYEKRIVVEKYY